MKIAITCEDGNVFQHFGHTPGFAVFETDENTIISETLLDSGSSGGSSAARSGGGGHGRTSKF